MSDDSLAEYSKTFHADIATDAYAVDMLREEAFVEKAGLILEEYGEIQTCQSCSWKNKRCKIDAFDIDDDYESLTLIVSDWLDEADPVSAKIPDSQVDRSFRHGLNFLTDSIKGGLKDRIDVSNPARDLAQLIFECRKELTTVKLILVTDGVTRERRGDSEEIDGIGVIQTIWDLNRFHTFEKTGEREEISIDFLTRYGRALPCVAQQSSEGKYTTYLAFVPGKVLADLYSDWKIRLLERNVRVFLSQRVKVNRGIRDSIREEPEMFCAYNNGITVYAREVEVTNSSMGAPAIARVHDFQIVNGGQTTASLYHTNQKDKAALDSITVQMKLMVINEEARPDDLPPGQMLADILVPKIGRFSNTQNRIQMADLLANDPPHPELHAISQNLAAPDPTGGSVQTYWFYEKSRGSYEETRRLEAKTPAQRKKFDQKYPKVQRFDKGKFGKAWHAYRQQPHIVCLGAMKNFAHFNSWLQDQKELDLTRFFKQTVALVMIWNETERIVRRQKFGGYTHAIVAYTLSWLHYCTGMRIDLEEIWAAQVVDDEIKETIENMCFDTNEHIRDTQRNVTEWVKRIECWENHKKRMKPDILPLKHLFVSGKKPVFQSGTRDDALEFCKSRGSNGWYELSKWLKSRGFMTGKARNQCFNMGRALQRGKEPTPILSKVCKNIWEQAENSYNWKYEAAD